MGPKMGPIIVIRDDHGGAVSLHEMEHSVEILVGVDENASSGKDRPHFVSLKAHQVAELALALARRLDRNALYDFELEILKELQLRVPGAAGEKGGEPT
jgi:hypothetical protein